MSKIDTEAPLPNWLAKQYPFNRAFKELPAGKLHFIDEGNGTPVIMLHGNPTWSFYYRNLVHHLKDHYRCIVPDHLGCGLSDRPSNYNFTLKERIDDIENLVEQLNLPKYHLIVHDWGGAIGMGLATRKPERVESITLLNTAAFRSSHIPSRISLCRAPLVGRFIVCALNGFAGPAVFMATAKGLPDKVKKGLLYPYRSIARREAVYQFVKDIPLNDSHPSWDTLGDIEDKLPSLASKPILIQWGAKDFCFNDHFLNRWKEFYPDAQCDYYTEAGHYVIEDEAESVNSKIKSFLSSC